MKDSDPIRYEKLFSRLRGGLVSARETALNISASPIVRELGELCFALYTPEGDSVALSTGIIVHVHTMSRRDQVHGPQRLGGQPGDRAGRHLRQQRRRRSATSTTPTCRRSCRSSSEGELLAWAGGVTHVIDIGARRRAASRSARRPRFDDGIDLPA